MHPFPTSTLALVIQGDALHAVHVRSAPWGTRARLLGVSPRFLTSPHDECRAALAPVPASARTVLVVPASWCALRPVAVGVSQWPGARQDILASIASFFPLEPDDAAVGLVERAAPSRSTEPSANVNPPRTSATDARGTANGYLVAARRQSIRPWTETITRALGRTVSAVLSPHMLLPALGLQGAPSAIVIEPSALGLRVAHRLEWGRIVELGAPLDASLTQNSAVKRAELPSDQPPEPGATVLSPAQLGVAAAVLPRVAPGSCAPLMGEAARTLPRWAPATAAALLAIGAWLGASVTLSARYDRAAVELQARINALEPELREAADTRARARGAIELLAARRDIDSPQWNSVLPQISAATDAVPDSGFVSTVEFTRAKVRLTGETTSAGDVLRALAQSALFTGARQRNPATPGVTGKETFDLEADVRADETAAPKQATPAPSPTEGGTS